MLEEQVDDVGVALLRRLVERSVSILGTHSTTVRKQNTLGAAHQRLASYLGFAVDPRLVLNQEVCHFCVAIVTGHMYRCVTHLNGGRQTGNMGVNT